jgi:hypothetical protein
MQSIAQEQHFNPLAVSPENLLFCHHGQQLLEQEATARANFISDSTPRRNAASARKLAGILRQRHRHLSGCSCCLLSEVFQGSIQ